MIEVRAAGGVVARDAAGGGIEIAVVHRPRYGDWSLPKGKLDPGEGFTAAALREVEEETGFRCELRDELEPSSYRDRKGRSKIVRWWLMERVAGEFESNAEVDELRWLPPDEAQELLTYEHDRRLVEEARRILGSNKRPSR